MFSQIGTASAMYMKDAVNLLNLLYRTVETGIYLVIVKQRIKVIKRALFGAVKKIDIPFKLYSLSLPVFVNTFVLFVKFSDGV